MTINSRTRGSFYVLLRLAIPQERRLGPSVFPFDTGDVSQAGGRPQYTVWGMSLDGVETDVPDGLRQDRIERAGGGDVPVLETRPAVPQPPRPVGIVGDEHGGQGVDIHHIGQQ